MRCTPNTSCSPAATRNSTAAWKTPPSRIPSSLRSSDLPAVDPVVEPDARRLLDLLRGHRLDGVDRHEVVAVLVGGDSLEERRLHDVVFPVAPRTRQRFRLHAL